MILCKANIDGRISQPSLSHSIKFFDYRDVFVGLCNAIDRIKLGPIPNAIAWHEKIQNWYSWYWVAQQTEVVYQHIMRKEAINLRERIRRLVCVIIENELLIDFFSSPLLHLDINNADLLAD